MSTALLALGAALSLAAGPPLDVEVRHVSPTGAVEPLAGSEVVLERWSRPPGTDKTRVLGECLIATTDAHGRARFEAVDAIGADELVPTVVFQGVSFSSTVDPAATSATPTQVTVYDVAGDLAPVRVSYQVGLDLRDGFLVVDQTVVLDNRSSRALIPSRGAGPLRIALPLPAVMGGALAFGMLPSETAARHISTRATPERGRFLFDKGAVFWDGPILPGRSTTLDARYALPIVAERQDLAFSSPLTVESVVVTTTWSERTAPRVVPVAPYLGLQGEDGEKQRRLMRLERPPAIGEDVVVRVDRLPRPLSVHARAAWVGSSLLLGLFFLAVIAGRRRDD